MIETKLLEKAIGNLDDILALISNNMKIFVLVGRENASDFRTVARPLT